MPSPTIRLLLQQRQEVRERVREVEQELAENADAIRRVGAIILDPREKLFHAQARTRARELEVERDSLVARRDVLNSQRASGGALAEFVSFYRDNIGQIGAWVAEAFHADPTADAIKHPELDNWSAGMVRAFAKMPLARQLDIIKGLYRVRVERGGRGADRMRFTPLGAMTTS